MNRARLAGLVASASLIPLAAAAAQTRAPETPPPGNPTPPQANPGTSVGLQEVIVTATRRNENLQNVPVAVSAITSSQLTAKGVFNTADLNNSLPNLQVQSAYGETQPNFTLRGVGVGTEYNSNAASPVGVYVDEVYQSFRASQGQQLYDLDQVEVVRGPQGTLYGRNTTGGAINFITRKPRLADDNGYVTAGYGNYDRKSFEGAYEHTFIPGVLGVRISGTYVDSDPFIHNLLPAGSVVKSNPNVTVAPTSAPATGISPGGPTVFSYRGEVRYKPTDRLDITLKGYASSTIGGQDSPQNQGHIADGGVIDLRTALIGALYGVPGLSTYLPPTYNPNAISDKQIEANSIGHAKVITSGAVLNMRAEITPDLHAVSITEYDRTHFELLPQIDCDGTPYDVCAIGYESKSQSFNQDFRLDYTHGPIKAIAGVYYGHDRIRTLNRPDFLGFLDDVAHSIGLPLTYFNPGGLVNPTGFPTRLNATQNFTQIRDSTAVYGEASYEITPKLKFTGGLRYTWDDFEYGNALTTYYDDTGAARLYAVSDYQVNGAYQNYLIGVSPGTAHPLDRKDSSSAITGRAILDYKPTDATLVYGSYSRGYRGGTYNGLAFQTANQVYFVQPETVDAYEVGFKSRWLENRLQFNASAFYYTYKNQQNQLISPQSVTFLVSLDGHIDGFEGELTYKVTPRLSLNASVGVLDSSFNHGRCPTAPITAAVPQVGNCLSTGVGNVDVGGNPFPYAPKVSTNFGFDWRVIDIGDGRVSLHGDAAYQGSYYYDTFGSYNYVSGNVSDAKAAQGPLRQGGGDYWIANTRLSYDINHITVAAYVRNLTDKLYYPNGINVEASYGSDYLVRALPRTYGVEATYRF